MPIKVRGADGQETEHFSQEEVDKKIEDATKKKEDDLKSEFDGKLTKAQEEAVEQYKKDNPDQSEKVGDLQKKLDDANKELEELKDDDGNMPEGQKERLQKKIEDLKGKVEKVTKTSQEEIDKLKNTMQENKDQLKNKYLDNLADGDDEKRKKIELEFDNYMPDKDSEEDIKTRAERAYTIVEGQAPKPGLLDGVSNASARGEGNPSPQGGDAGPSENAKEIGKHIGVGEKDWEKYDGKDPVALATGGEHTSQPDNN